MRRRSETEENEGNEDPKFFGRNFVLFVIFCSSVFRVVVSAKVRDGETPLPARETRALPRRRFRAEARRDEIFGATDDD